MFSHIVYFELNELKIRLNIITTASFYQAVSVLNFITQG